MMEHNNSNMKQCCKAVRRAMSPMVSSSPTPPRQWMSSSPWRQALPPPNGSKMLPLWRLHNNKCSSVNSSFNRPPPTPNVWRDVISKREQHTKTRQNKDRAPPTIHHVTRSSAEATAVRSPPTFVTSFHIGPNWMPYVYTVFGPNGLWRPSVGGGGVCDIQPTCHMCTLSIAQYCQYGQKTFSGGGRGSVTSKIVWTTKWLPCHNC